MTDYKRIIESTTDFAIFTMDLDRRITTWNRGAELLLGWSREEAIGRLGDMIFPEDGRSDIAEQETQAVHEKGSAIDELWHKRKDDSRFWAVGRMMSLTSRSGEITGYVKILMDQTENKQNQQQLQKMNERFKRLNDTLEERVEERTKALKSYQEKLRSLVNELNKSEERERQRLAGDLHDNLGQILAVARLQLELSQKKNPDHAGSQDINNAVELIDDAIRYTRALMSELKIPEKINKEDLATMMEWLAEVMKKRGLEVTIRKDAETIPLHEEVRIVLVQSVREVLFNVIKHADTDEAYIYLSKIDSEVKIVIKDEGRGFDQGNPDFVQTEESGFGLFQILERLHLLGGSMTIDSAPGSGTTVTLIAPLKDDTLKNERAPDLEK